MKFDSVVIRFSGEIGIKGRWTRRAYERLLRKNIKETLKYHSVSFQKIRHQYGRIYIKTKTAQEAATKSIRVFGVSSASPALETTSNLDDIINKTVDLADNTLKKRSSFAVRCRRVGNHPYSSRDICEKVGAQILSQLKTRRLKVKLKNPQFTVGIEVRNDFAYVFTETLHGVGGLPLGSQPQVVCLLNGAAESAVAGWLAMKRGCPIVPLYFDTSLVTGVTADLAAVDVAGKLFEWSISCPRRVYITPSNETYSTILKNAPKEIASILFNRLMYRVAEQIAEKEGAEGITTGETVGEGNHTLTNLRIQDEVATRYPIHRPLLGFTVAETEEIAMKIGLRDSSNRKKACCRPVPSKSTTMAKLEVVKEAEQKLETGRIVERIMEKSKLVII